jgi:hypothetical protein
VKRAALLLLVTCAHLPPKPPEHERCRLVVAGSPDASPNPWASCTDDDLEKLREKNVVAQVSERVPGTGYRLLCLDTDAGRPCGERDLTGKAGDVDVLQPWPDMAEQHFVLEVVGQPRLDGAWRDLARKRLYATGRYRDVTVTVDATEKDGLHNLLVELDRLEARPARVQPCPRLPNCSIRNCTKREDGCAECACETGRDYNAEAVGELLKFISWFLPRP